MYEKKLNIEQLNSCEYLGSAATEDMNGSKEIR